MRTREARRTGVRGAAGPPREAPAFTMVDLLSVLTILALLVSMLTPYLTRAREVSRRAVCMDNQKTLSEAIHGYADAHDGRCVGSALMCNDIGASAISWQDILNAEWFKSDRVVRVLSSKTVPKGKICCPNVKFNPAWDPWGCRVFQLSGDAAGGDVGTDPVLGDTPRYGRKLDPNQVSSMYSPQDSGGRFFGVDPTSHHGPYQLGAQLSLFRRADYAYLVIESEYPDDYIGNPSPWPADGRPIMNGGTDMGFAPWGAAAGPGGRYDFFAMRHCLPADLSLYQSQASACFSYVDGHVAAVNPVMDLVAKPRFYIDPG